MAASTQNLDLGDRADFRAVIVHFCSEKLQNPLQFHLLFWHLNLMKGLLKVLSGQQYEIISEKLDLDAVSLSLGLF